MKQYSEFDKNKVFKVLSSSGNTFKWNNALENLYNWEILLEFYK